MLLAASPGFYSIISSVINFGARVGSHIFVGSIGYVVGLVVRAPEEQPQPVPVNQNGAQIPAVVAVRNEANRIINIMITIVYLKSI